MIEAIALAAVMYTYGGDGFPPATTQIQLSHEARPAAPTHDPLRTQAASRGGVGRYGDSNVTMVWKGVSGEARRFWMCVRNHESRHRGHYRAINQGGSGAAGAGQWMPNTWRGLAHWVKVNGKYVARGYSTADRAPAWVQDAAFVHVWNRGGMSMWRGTHCGYGT